MPAAVRHPARDDHQRLLASLNDRQREAVTASDGPILVIASPGSGEQYRKALDLKPQFASVRDVLLPELDDGGQRGLRARLPCSR